MNKQMSVSENMTQPVSPEMLGEDYSTLSKAAVVAVVTGVLSLIGFYFSVFIILGVVALACGLVAIKTIRSAPHEFSGRTPAMIGVLTGLVSVVGGLGFHAYIYNTEVREGYERISFVGDLKTGQDTMRNYTERAEELDGTKVFLKGYVRPGLKSKGINDFLLVGDLGQCCFGGTPKISEVVRIRLPEDTVTHYDWSLRKIHGTLKVHKQKQDGDHIAKDVLGYVYEIDADSINY